MNLTKAQLTKIAKEAMKITNEAAKEVENGHLHRDGIAAVLVAEAIKGDTDVREALLAEPSVPVHEQ